MGIPEASPRCVEFNDEDLALAMREMESFVDITQEDLREVCRLARGHAAARTAAAAQRPLPAPAAAPPAGFFAKVRGGGHAPPAERPREIGWSWLGAFLGIGFIAFANERVFEKIDLLMIVGSFGASAVLIYGAIKSPLAQPRNLVGGHVLSALVGVACQQLFPATAWLAAALAVSTAIAVMHATRTLHPPGGATALIAVIGGEGIHDLGFAYALFPVGGGALILLAIALVVNNIPRHRRYPEFWL